MHFLSHLICIFRCFCSISSSRDYLEPLKDLLSGLPLVFPSDNYPFQIGGQSTYKNWIETVTWCMEISPKVSFFSKISKLGKLIVSVNIFKSTPLDLESWKVLCGINSLSRRTMSSLFIDIRGRWRPFNLLAIHVHKQTFTKYFRFLGVRKNSSNWREFCFCIFSFNFTIFSRSQRCKMRLFLVISKHCWEVLLNSCFI